jgi:hypothetical protein
MKLPVVRVSVRGMMVVVAVVSLLFVSGQRYLSRPHPTLAVFSGGYTVFWSDGTGVKYDRTREVYPAETTHHGPIVMVRWSDRSRSFHLNQMEQAARRMADRGSTGR